RVTNGSFRIRGCGVRWPGEIAGNRFNRSKRSEPSWIQSRFGNSPGAGVGPVEAGDWRPFLLAACPADAGGARAAERELSQLAARGGTETPGIIATLD